jgi:hypothetical protein
VHQRHTWKTETFKLAGGLKCADPTNHSIFRDVCTSTVRVHPSWENPAAVLIALGGLAVAAAVGPRFTRR